MEAGLAPLHQRPHLLHRTVLLLLLLLLEHLLYRQHDGLLQQIVAL